MRSATEIAFDDELDKLVNSEEMKQHAALLRLEFSLGLVNEDEVIAWAKDLLEQFDDPPLPLSELSLSAAGGIKHTLALLARLAPDAEIASRSGALFADLTKTLRSELADGHLTPDEVASILYQAVWKTPLLLPDEQIHFCTWVDDEFELVRRGIKERARAEADLLAFLTEASA